MTKVTSIPKPDIETAEEPLLETSHEGSVEEAAAAPDDSKTLIFQRSHVYAALLPLAFVAGLAVGYLFWGRASAKTVAPAEAQNPAAQAQSQEVQRYDVPEDDDPVWGPDQASITIIEFSDYECPYCRKWHLQIWPLIREAYPDQVRLVYRDFPLTNIHANAIPAAAAANCAGEQDAYWEFSDLLFSMELELSAVSYEQYASGLGLDMGVFSECLESGRQDEEVQGDYEYAANLGVRSTPTFFINGIAVVGAQPFEVFQQVIEAELAGEIP